MPANSFWHPGDEIVIWGVNVLLQITIVTALALVIGRCVRRNAAARYCVLFSALSLVLVSPLTAVILQETGWNALSVVLLDHQSTPAENEMVRETRPVKELNAELDSPASSEVDVDISEVTFEQPRIREFATAPNNVSTTLSLGKLLRITMPSVLLIWLVGASAFFARLCYSWWRLAEILRSAKPLAVTTFERVIADACRTVGIMKTAPVFSSSSVRSPVAAGIWRPLVILPDGLVDQMTPDQLHQILIHEMAHIFRRDQVVTIVQGFAAAAFWFHPLVWLLNRQLACAREEICDNYVLSSTDALSYSRMLLRLAELLGNSRPLPTSVGLLTSHWKLETRIAGILNKRRSSMTCLTTRWTAPVSTLPSVADGVPTATRATSESRMAFGKSVVTWKRP
jgi:beta-lactamase regulating signal transducer with metallopeptidase domain